jgi:hypothetical protein
VFLTQMPNAPTLLLALAGAALIAGPGPAAAATVSPATPKRGGVQGSLAGCKTTAAARGAVFKGSMPSIPGFKGRMEMRFDLFARSATLPAWTEVDVDGFGEWDLSDDGVSGFIIKKRVGGLQGGYSYRAVVRFRWRSGSGRIVRAAKKVTQPCTQPDATPDLTLAEPSIAAGVRNDVVVYRVVVRNSGTGTAAPFDVVLAVNGVAQPAQRVGPLAPGATAPVTFQAPRCEAGTIVRFTVDAKAEILESSETNNALERRCAPAKAAAAAR